MFRVLREEAEQWSVPEKNKNEILQGFTSPRTYYDTIITASDSSEIRLKPHRDLYSITLGQLGISRESLHRVAGFEDSESGTIAVRASGIRLCCALPFSETSGHFFKAASYVATGGLPEVILQKNMFLPPFS